MRRSLLPIACLAALTLPASALAQFATSDASLALPGSAELKVRSIQWGAGRSASGSGGAVALDNWTKLDGLATNRETTEGRSTAPATAIVKNSPSRDPGAVANPVHEQSIENLFFKHSIVSPRDVASGQASGKRMQEPITLSNGSLILKLASPWTACAAGDRFDGAYLTVGTTHRYRLDGLEVASCSAEQVSFNYAKVELAGS